jgi:hypothetical protein
VRRFRGCLDGLAGDQRELLTLRAGLDGPPRTRSNAAALLGISTREAAGLERRGLRALRSACGGTGSSGGGTAAIADAVARPDGMPTLQPASYLAASNAPDLERPADLAKRGEQDVGGASESSPPAGEPGSGGSDRQSIPPTAASTPLGDTGAASPTLWIVLATMAAALALLVLLSRRRTVAEAPRGPRVTAATAAPPVPLWDRSRRAGSGEPEPAPTATEETATAAGAGFAASDWGWEDDAAETQTAERDATRPGATRPGTDRDATRTSASPVGSDRDTTRAWAAPAPDDPVPPQPSTPAPDTRSTASRATRAASTVATGLASFAVRELMRRRRR